MMQNDIGCSTKRLPDTCNFSLLTYIIKSCSKQNKDALKEELLKQFRGTLFRNHCFASKCEGCWQRSFDWQKSDVVKILLLRFLFVFGILVNFFVVCPSKLLCEMLIDYFVPFHFYVLVHLTVFLYEPVAKFH